MMKDKFLKRLSVNKLSKETTRSTKYCITNTESFLGNKCLENATEDDLLNYIEHLREQGMAESSIGLVKAKLRQFYGFCYDETDDKKYRRFMKLLKGQIERKKISPQDILTTEEIKRLINLASMEQDRAIVSILYEGGLRIGELMALTVSMVEMIEASQEVMLHIPNLEGCKTGARSVLCLEIHGYVQDWLKCHPNPAQDSNFIQLQEFGIRQRLEKLAERANIKKPINPHNFRHSAITRSAMLGMSDIDMSLRYWGIPHSDMVSVYVHLSEEMKSEKYRKTMGMSNEDTKVINSLASRCVSCGRLIQSGELCPQCQENQELRDELGSLKFQNERDFQYYDARIQQLESIIKDPIAIMALADTLKEKMAKK